MNVSESLSLVSSGNAIVPEPAVANTSATGFVTLLCPIGVLPGASHDLPAGKLFVRVTYQPV